MTAKCWAILLSKCEIKSLHTWFQTSAVKRVVPTWNRNKLNMRLGLVLGQALVREGFWVPLVAFRLGCFRRSGVSGCLVNILQKPFLKGQSRSYTETQNLRP